MNSCASFRANEAEGGIASTLKLIEKRRAKEEALIRAIERAQEAWNRYREAELEALFPEEEKQAAYGSMYNMCRAQQRDRLAKLRQAELQLYVEGDPEAHGCSGAVADVPKD
jgi:uncharacterized protein YecT (DUF1311 family)